MRFIIIQLLLISVTSCKGQEAFGTDKLIIEKVIEMPTVSGRIDHMAINLKDKVLYVAALGNNTVEAIDLNKGSVIRSIKGIEKPQGIAYIPEQNEIIVASGGDGDCVFYNATTFEKVGTIHLAGHADNIRYDAINKKVFVGYGNGGMARIDAVSHKQLGDVKLPAYPESFQLDKKNSKMFVNLPDDHSISVIDLKSFKVINYWKISGLRANFPMTLDTASDHVIVGFRHPATLAVYDSKTGKEISRTELVDDVDDVFFDAASQQVLASGGGGHINIFQKASDNSYKLISKIPSRTGARTSFLVPSLRTFIVAERAEGGKSAATVVYKLRD